MFKRFKTVHEEDFSKLFKAVIVAYMTFSSLSNVCPHSESSRDGKKHENQM